MSGTPPSRRAILVVDDDDEVRAHLAAALEYGGYSVRGVATGEEALEAAVEEAPSLVLLDVCLPGISGYHVCRGLRDRFGEGLPILFISAARTESYDRVAALLVGGDDYLTKPISPDELLIRVGRLVRRSTPLDAAVTATLTAREQDVLRLLAEGMRPREIAANLTITEKTVRTHVDHIFRKLGVHSHAEAIAVAYRRSLVETPV